MTGASDILLRTALEDLLQVASERAKTYGKLESAFKEMCQYKYEKTYMEVFPDLTEEFKVNSEKARQIERQLAEQGESDLAEVVRIIQRNEHKKLQTTLRLHSLRRDYSFFALPFQHKRPDEWSTPEHDDDPANDGSHYPSEHICGFHHKPQLATCVSGFDGSEEEWNLACSEAVLILEDVINEINEQLSTVFDQLQELSSVGS